ncbi:hypothetical protein [Arabidopsis thaliana]|nr:hypothetical protein [Arabidopsis thaliana]CAB78465.1 hypothetical protein [Arabidopsis thaliana]
MHPINAVVAARMLAGISQSNALQSEAIPFGSLEWITYAGISCFLVLFAGIMSGLTLGLMSLGLVELEILQRSGTPKEKKQSAAIFPVVQKQHQLLVTLLLFNALAMEGLPIYLDKIFNEYVAIILSVTFVLFVGEVIPQAICTRYGLAVGANLVWLMLDWVLGHNDPLFRRAQLKALVSIHGEAAGKGGELTHDETTIISGALDLTEKTAQEAMTPIESTFSLDVNSKLDRVPANMPLYDILNEFQKGSSHMAAVVKVKGKSKGHPSTLHEENSGESNVSSNNSELTAPLLLKREGNHDSVIVRIDKANGQSFISEAGRQGFSHTSEEIEDGDEEIVDETDEYIDVHKRIRVATVAAVAISSLARAPSGRRLLGPKGSGGPKTPKASSTPKPDDKLMGTMTGPPQGNN